jgi:hypothetical protein
MLFKSHLGLASILCVYSLWGQSAVAPNKGVAPTVRSVIQETSPRPKLSAVSDPALRSVLLTQSVSLGKARSEPGTPTVPLKAIFQNGYHVGITAYEVQLNVAYSDGGHRTFTAGADLIKTVALAAAKAASNPNTPPDTRRTFKPGAVQPLSYWIPANKAGGMPVSVDVAPTAVVFEDLTARGDAGVIASIAARRAREAKDYDDLLADIAQIMAATDHAAALNAHVNKLSQDGSKKTIQSAAWRINLLGAVRVLLASGDEAVNRQVFWWREERDSVLRGASIKGVATNAAQ